MQDSQVGIRKELVVGMWRQEKAIHSPLGVGGGKDKVYEIVG
jgi:hypothetical protein